MHPLVRYWCGRGLKAIDDGIIAVKGKTEVEVESSQVRQDLLSAGFVVNIEKCVWEPSQNMEWLGFNIDLAQASLIGKITSISPAIGPCNHSVDDP